jgi:hypothetical protein
MRKLLSFILFAIAPLCASAQSYTTITATSCIGLGDGSSLSAGTFQVQATDGNDGDIPFRAGGGFQSLKQGVTRTVVNGSLTSSLQIGTPANSSPVDILYRITITDNTTKKVTVYRKVPISGSTWDFCSMDTGSLLPTIPHSTIVGPAGPGPTASNVAAAITSQTGCSTAGKVWEPASNTCITAAGGVSKSGDTMTGPLVLPADPTTALQASTKQYVDAHVGGGGVNKAGDTMTGPLVLPADPTTALQASTKQYVDAHGGIPVGALPNINNFMSNISSCSTQICNVVIFGDSFAICDSASCAAGPATSTNRWPEQLRIALQASYGSHGTGIVPANFGLTTGHSGANLNPEAWSCTGTVAFDTNTLGPFQTAAQAQISLLHMSNGSTCTFNDARAIKWGGSTGGLVTYCMTTAASGSLAVSIDGGAATGTACGTTSGSATAHAVSLADTTFGTHSVTYTSTGNSYIYGAEGTAGTSGISVHNLAVSGSMAEIYNSANKLAFSDLIPSGTQVAIVAELTNDVNFGESTGNYTSYLTTILNHEVALSGTPPVLQVISPVTNIYSSGAQIPYVAGALNLCTTLAISCANIQDRWGTTYSNTNSIWNSGHPNDKGSIGEYSQIVNSLINPVPSTPATSSSSGPVNGTSTVATTYAETATNSAAGAIVYAHSALCPNLTSGQYCNNALGGVDSTNNNNMLAANFFFAGSGSASNRLQFNFTGGAGGSPIAMWANGHVNIGSAGPTDCGFTFSVNCNSNTDANGNTVIGGQTLQGLGAGFTSYTVQASSIALYYYKNTGASADNTLWRTESLTNGDWRLDAVNDAGSVATPAITVTRSGTTINAIMVPMLTTPYLLPGIIYSAAGTPLPTCAVGIKGERAVVSDATTPTYMGAYTSGGAITAEVICSFNGTTYSWLAH